MNTTLVLKGSETGQQPRLVASLFLLGAVASSVFPSLIGQESVAFAATSSPLSAPTLGGSTENRGKVQSSNTPVKVIERTDSVVGKKKVLSQREKREAKGGAVSRSEIESIQNEKNFSKALDQEIGYMEKLLPRLPKKNEQRPEILRRLIENYHAKSLLAFFSENRKYDSDWKKWDTGGRKTSEPIFDQKGSKIWTSKVIQRAQVMISDYPSHKRLDEAYYQIAFAFDQLTSRKEAAQYYSTLVQRFPNSKHVPDAHYALGEFYFDQQDFKKAIAAYSEVSRYTRSPIYPWAIYKKGWSYYNLQDYRNALGSFKSIVSLSDTATSGTAASKARLKDEALNQIVVVYADIGNVGEAEQYFSQVGGEKYYADMLLKFAEILREKGNYPEAVRILKIYINKNPYALKAGEIQIQIVDIANLNSDKRYLWQEMKFLLTNYRPDTAWGQKNSADPKFKEIADKVHTVAITYPKKMHAEAQKESNKYKYAQAETGYNIYLTYYPNRPEAIEVRFNLGELQYSSERYREATQTFSILTTLGPKTLYFQKSADYLVSAAYIPVEKDLTVIRKRPAKLGSPPIPISGPLQEYLKACEQFGKWFPKDKKNSDCQIDSAEIYLKHNQYGEAEKRLTMLATSHPDKPEGKKSAEILLWLAEKDPKKLSAVAASLRKIPQYNNPNTPLGKILIGIEEQTALVGADDLSKGGKFIDSAKRFEAIGNRNPTGVDADKTFFNAAVNYRKGNDPDKAVVNFQKVTGFQKSPLAADAYLNMIDLSADRLQLDKASQYSALFLSRFAKHPKAPIVSIETCYLFDALDDINRATQVCMQVVNAKNSNSQEAAETLADLYERSNRHKELLGIVDSVVLRGNISPSAKIEYLAKAADAERKLGRGSAVKAREAQMSQIFASSPASIQGPALAEIGRIEFEKQMPVMQKYQSVRLQAQRPDGSDLMLSINKKNEALQQVEAAFKSVIKTGDAEWGVAALYVIGSAYEQLGADFKNPPMPPGVPEAEKQKLRAKLGELGKGINEKSKTYYEQAAQSVSKFAVYSDYSKRVADALARLNPKSNKKLDDWVPTTMFVGAQWLEVGSVRQAMNQLGAPK